jgi:ABC-type antimicrobial peptide transport system permease subunit
VLESIIYGIIGAPIGILLGYLTISYYGAFGFDLTAFGEGMKTFGYDPILYFTLDTKYYFIYTAYILFATIIGGLYPSRLATKLNPIDAIRAI